jgi:integrase/recombinase XerD
MVEGETRAGHRYITCLDTEWITVFHKGDPFMPERFVQRGYHLNRHLAAPFLEERRHYLSHLVKEGRAFPTLKSIAAILLAIAKHIPRHKQAVTQRQIALAAERWLKQYRSGCSPKIECIERAKFIFHARNWLRFLGRIDESVKRPRFSSSIDAFSQFQHERGLAFETIRKREEMLTRFCFWVEKRCRTLNHISSEDVSRYVRWSGFNPGKRTTISLHMGALRAFFRFAETKCWCKPGLSNLIDGPRLYRYEGLPRGPKWQDVERLLLASQANTPTCIRNHAILLLFAVYGFRAGEVCRLRLEDIDWHRESISVLRTKQGERQSYPLIPTVGAALVRYLREVRQPTTLREIFVSREHPIRPLTTQGVYAMVRTHQRQLGIKPPHYGPHSLRHACATHLLAEGFSLKEIGDHLGHRSLSSTQIYAKVDVAALRKVADSDLKEFVVCLEAGDGASSGRLTNQRCSRQLGNQNTGGQR